MKKTYKPITRTEKASKIFKKKTLNVTDKFNIKHDEDDIENVDEYWETANSVIGNHTIDSIDGTELQEESDTLFDMKNIKRSINNGINNKKQLKNKKKRLTLKPGSDDGDEFLDISENDRNKDNVIKESNEYLNSSAKETVNSKENLDKSINTNLDSNISSKDNVNNEEDLQNNINNNIGSIISGNEEIDIQNNINNNNISSIISGNEEIDIQNNINNNNISSIISGNEEIDIQNSINNNNIGSIISGNEEIDIQNSIDVSTISKNDFPSTRIALTSDEEEFKFVSLKKNNKGDKSRYNIELKNPRYNKEVNITNPIKNIRRPNVSENNRGISKNNLFDSKKHMEDDVYDNIIGLNNEFESLSNNFDLNKSSHSNTKVNNRGMPSITNSNSDDEQPIDSIVVENARKAGVINKVKPLICTKDINTAIIELDYMALTNEEKAEKSFSIFVIKGKILLKSGNKKCFIKNGEATVISKNQLYSIICETKNGASLFVSYAL